MEVQVVVTASRREQAITKVPYAISVITAKDIRAAGSRSIPDALRLVPGVDVAELSHGNYAVSLRGFAGLFANKVLVLVDGRQIFDSVMNGTYWGAWPFQLEDIERIEVIRGPGGVIWGANAVNGVINIITKDPEDQLGWTLTLGGGSRGSQKEHVGYAGRDGKLRFRISGEYEGSDGFRGRGGFLAGNFDDQYSSVRADLHAIYEVSEDETLTFSAGSSVTRDNWPLPSFSQFGALQAESQANYILANWSRRVDSNETYRVTGYVNDFFTTTGARWSEYRYQQFALQFGHTFMPSSEHTITWGIDTRWDLTSAANADPFMLSQAVVRSGVIGLYRQDQWQLDERWTLTLGARGDYDFYGGIQPSGRASLSYALSDSSVLYGAVSRAFHMPSGARRFIDFPLVGELIRVTTSRGVEPEILNAYEVGYRGRPTERLAVAANAFVHDYRDIIETSPQFGPPGLLQLRSDNGSSLNLYGFEIDARYAASEALSLIGNFTFQRPSSDTLAFGGGGLSPPRRKFMIGARYSPAPDVHLSGHLYFVDSVDAPNGALPIAPQKIDSYYRLDLQAEFELADDRGSIAVGVRNLLDAAHPEGGDSAMDNGDVPRMYYAELRFRIG